VETFFLFVTPSRPALGPTRPHNQWVPGAFSIGLIWPRRVADHLPPSSAKLKMRGVALHITLTSSWVGISWSTETNFYCFTFIWNYV